ncbi:vWA domain-containing protein [Acetivibrio straminisolvens]|uniref:von Willebrand factor type A domain protein n=2 Tax=Acetivibrio straminisolvens TaxID=253314 RepID=W4VAM9_9FIRM|nr:YfbK domain-containing protein [Acetivibrio straminisolvens]GAE90450.1 von Willebrand factor type A domain protein [Acetivibrio straminisolvens JCM 21531]
MELEAGGSTAGAEGIKLAYDIAKKNFIKSGNNRVILATDGDFNVGVSSEAELVRLIEKKRNEGIFLTVLGFGTGNYKDSKMESLADKGNGNYAYIDNIAEARKVLVNEMGATLNTVAKDVKIQVEFNPAKVKAYRLIGYENRLLRNEDFNDDSVDAGEIGAGHSVTALYEIAPVDSEFEVPGVDELKYQKSQLIDSNEVATVKIRYKKPESDTSELLSKTVLEEDEGKVSENLKFAAAVAEFGLLLRESKYKGNSSYDRVLQVAKQYADSDEEGYRNEFVKLVEKAKRID